ncbi:hypothetical protein EBS02_01275 [bacterium]|nr:hypothetical protein [bacterium]
MNSSKILNFEDFLKSSNNAITENETIQDVLKNAISQVTGVSTETQGKSKGPIIKTGTDLQNMFWSTRIGKKFLSGKDQEFLQKMADEGLLDPKFLQDEGGGTDNSLPNTPKAKELQELLNRMGLGQSSLIDFKKLPGRGKYEFTKARDMDWEKINKLLKDKKIEYDPDQYTLVALRNSLDVKKKQPNLFTDALFLLGPESDKTIDFYPATTTPGPAFMVQSYRNYLISNGDASAINPKGLAILQPGVYTYKLGKHKGKEDALIQAEPVKVQRYKPVSDINQAKFTTLTPGNEEEGNFGINIHQGADQETVDNISSGCIAIQYRQDMKSLIKKLKDANQNQIELVLLDLDSIN